MRKILILYATAGVGHKKAAEAVYNELRAQNAEAEILDAVEFMSPMNRWMYSKGYLVLIKFVPRVWGLVYFLSDTPILKLFNCHLRRFINARACRKLIQYIIDKKPDIVISTHFTTSEIVSYAKQRYGLNTKLMTIITDYGVHNFWIAPHTDLYCCAADSTKKILMKKGVSENCIVVSGIPIDKKFLSAEKTDACYEEFQLKKDKFTVLIVTGGIGAGPIDTIVDLLQDEVQLLVICGHNKPLNARLTAKNYPDVRVFGFVDFMPKLMNIADAIVTKAGGLTTAESLAMELPLIFFFLIPGQEEINALTLKNYRAATIASNPEEIKNAVLKLKNSPENYAAVKKIVTSLSKPQAASEIVDAIKSLIP